MDLVPLDLGRRCVPYAEAWQTQREVHAAVVDGRRPDTVLLVEHESVYTAGRRTAAWDRPVDGTPVVDVDRGGRITWHGPGQLVVYPIIRLAQPIDVVGYVRALEQSVIDTCTELGVPTGRSQAAVRRPAVYTLSCSTSSTVSGRRPSATAACTSRWVCQASAYGTQRRPRSSGTRSMRARYLVDFARVVGGQRRVADRVRAGVVVAVAAEDPGLTASGGTGC